MNKKPTFWSDFSFNITRSPRKRPKAKLFSEISFEADGENSMFPKEMKPKKLRFPIKWK